MSPTGVQYAALMGELAHFGERGRPSVTAPTEHVGNEPTERVGNESPHGRNVSRRLRDAYQSAATARTPTRVRVATSRPSCG